MAWTSQLTNKYFEDGQLCIAVDYSDGTESGQGNFTRVYRQTTPQAEGWLETTINAEISRVEELQTWAETLGA